MSDLLSSMSYFTTPFGVAGEEKTPVKKASIPAPKPASSVDPIHEKGKNSDLYFVTSAIEIQNLMPEYIEPSHVTGYGETSTFVSIKYGSLERRTETFKESLHPEWNASYVFEFDPTVEEILFLFFSENLDTGEPKLFGHVVIPLNDTDYLVPVNTPFLRELCPIAKCGNEELKVLRDNHMLNKNSITWPSTKETIVGEVVCHLFPLSYTNKT